MTRILIVAVLLLAAGEAHAGGWLRPKNRTTAPTATIAPRSATPIPVVAKLQPVVGSVQRTGHFTNPLTHKAKFSNTVYNPISGQFGTNVFRR
ncbi:MAG TPA: hypothetical protein VGE74_06390 [Gemmata sp.]